MGCIVAVYQLTGAALARKKMPSPIYLHIKGLTCQHLQSVDKGFVSPVISWISSVVLLKKNRRRGKKISNKMCQNVFPSLLLNRLPKLPAFPPSPKIPNVWNNRRNSLQMYHFNALECFCFQFSLIFRWAKDKD